MIPDLQIDSQKRVVEQTKEIPLNVNGQLISIVIRKLSTGSRNKIRSDCTKTTILGGQPQVKVDDQAIQEMILSQAIVSAPFDTTIEGIKKLPCEVTDYLFEEYTQFAEPTQKKNLESANPLKETI